MGKIGIEDRILKKPGALTPEEYEVMKSHTVRGANILRPVEQLREMIPGIELHHESLDGKGYPYGLKGDDIPLPARIIAVADTFDAMTTNRPYQSAKEPEYAIQIINTLTRNKFDPNVVAALTSIFERGEISHEACCDGGERLIWQRFQPPVRAGKRPRKLTSNATDLTRIVTDKSVECHS